MDGMLYGCVDGCGDIFLLGYEIGSVEGCEDSWFDVCVEVVLIGVCKRLEDSVE